MRGKSFTGDTIIADDVVAAAMEARCLSEKYGKDFLDCDDLVMVLGVGKNNARDIMRSNGFPTITIGNRKVVSVLSFAMWSLNKDSGASI